MPEPSPKKLATAICFILTIGTLALYCPVLWHSFINYDDDAYIADNAHVRSGLSWPEVIWSFQFSGYAANWHPLTWISHMLDCQLFVLIPISRKENE